MDGQTKAVLVRIEGRVQGVGFRAWTQSEASRLGLRGWVRNEPDGSVAAHLEGSRDGVDRTLERLWIGPRGASVTQVSYEAVRPEMAQGGFRITR
jgi:acylphosphatase